MTEVTDAEEIKKLMKSKEPVAIFYYAAWCPHCKVMHQPFEELEKESGKVKFAKMESEDIPEDIKEKFSGYPHFVMVKDGKVQKEASGEMSKEELKSKLLGGLRRGGRRRLTRRTRSRRLRRTTRKSSH